MMLGVTLNKQRGTTLRLLCLGAHSDDIEIGCGGTLLRLMEDYPDLSICWIVFGAPGHRAVEARQSAEVFLQPVRQKQIVVKGFRDGFFPYIGAEVKDYFEQIKREISPDLIFTHYRHDLHQDHRLLSELTWNTYRDHLILEYELPKYDGDLGVPNLFVALDKRICQRKIGHLMTHFASQLEKDWFTEDTFLALLRLRGVEARVSGKYAEAFYCRKLVL
jgi:LmbE family N-acetylglucosaminyl deacetylase